MSAALKNKYIVRTRHRVLGRNDCFVPVNASQSKANVQEPLIHDAGQPIRDIQNTADASTLQRQTVHGATLFLAVSPVTQS